MSVQLEPNISHAGLGGLFLGMSAWLRIVFLAGIWCMCQSCVGSNCLYGGRARVDAIGRGTRRRIVVFVFIFIFGGMLER